MLAQWRSTLGIASLLLVPLAAHAQALSGVVLDPSGARVAGAALVVQFDRLPAVERIFTTTPEGAFDLADLAPGHYHIVVRADGFAPAAIDVDAPSGKAIEVRLTPAPVIAFVPVVSASKVEELRESLNTRVDVVGRDALVDTGAQTVGEILRDVPGVLTRRGSETAGAAGESIQGIDSRQVLVLLDGQPLAGARGIKRGAINLDRQSIFDLERIEVIKGASSALYGSDAIGGVVSLITRDPAGSAEITGAASGGSAGAFDAMTSAAFRRDRVSGLFDVERHQSDGFDLTPATFDTTGAPFRRLDLLGKVRAELPRSWSIQTLVNGYANTTTGRSNGELGPEEDAIDDSTVNAGVTLTGMAAGSAIQIRGYFASYSEDSTGRLAPPASTPIDPASLDERYGKVDATLSRALGGHQYLQAGVEWMRDEYSGTNRLKDDTGDAATTGVAWVQHRLAIGSRVTTTAGLRVDRHSAFGTAVSPKLAGNARVAGGLHVRASYGRGFRAPDLGQLYYRFLNPTNFYQVIGNPLLRPEHADSVQAGAEYVSSRQRARVGVNVFHNAVRDLIDSTSLGFVSTADQLSEILAREGLDPSFRPVLDRLLFTYKNLSDATTRGVEADGEAALSRQVSLSGAYTFLDAFDANSKLPLTGRNRHQGHVRLTWRSDRIGLKANVQSTLYGSWIAARSTTATGVSDTIAPRFALWDVYASQRIVRGLDGFTAIDNLGDSRDPNSGVILANGSPAPIYRPEIGRTFRFGVRWSWSR